MRPTHDDGTFQQTYNEIVPVPAKYHHSTRTNTDWLQFESEIVILVSIVWYANTTKEFTKLKLTSTSKWKLFIAFLISIVCFIFIKQL